MTLNLKVSFKYEFHQFSDHEDPLGDDFARAYLTQRYQVSVPPMVAFNGTIKKAGTLPILIP